MATPEELRRQQEENALLERENEILRKRLELQSESYSLSTSYLESIKEILGIQSKRTQFENDTLDINKKIQRAIRDQNLDLEDSVEKVKQVSRNKKLILEAQKQEANLSKDLTEKDKNRVAQATRRLQGIVNIQKTLDNELSLAKEDRKLSDDQIKKLKERLANGEKYLDTTLGFMSTNARLLFYTQQQVKELEKVNAEREKELTTTDKLVAAANKLPGELGKSVKLVMDLNAGGKLAALAIGAFLVKAILQADDKITDLQKAFGITRETARGISYELERQAITSGDIFITSKKLNQSFRELSAELGFAADISGQTLETFTNLTQRLGFNIKEATQLTYLARLQGENTETTLNNASKTVSALNKQKGTSINIKAVFNDIANASAATVVSLGGSVNALAEASTKARQLGLTLGEVDQIASSLLDFQSSIENELAAELMTGKQINLEAARYYALTNQTAKLTEEIGNNQELINAFATDNRLAQDAAAKSLGLSREELGKMVMQQQFLALGAEAFRAKFGEANYEQMQALSIGDKFRSTLEKIQEIIGNIGYAFEPLLNVFASLASSSTIVLGAVGALAGLSLVKLIGSLTLMASELAVASAGALTIGSVLTGGAIAIAVMAALGALAGALIDFKTMDDGISTGYGKRMLFDKGELFALNDNDNIIATTNPIPVNDIQSRPKGAIKVAPQQAQATPTQQNVKVTPSTTVVQLALNGANIGNATARSTYKVSSNIRQFGGNGIDTSATV
jgi:galactitol-specific phosphotransferase system IIB component